jgi:surfactin synthase thioesterase subunit
MSNANAWEPWWIRYSHRTAPKVRLFCFPFAGGGAGVFGGWSALLPESVEVVSLQLPGRETRMREPPLRSMPEILTQIVPRIAERHDLPFAFFGYSLGALIAFETARALRRVGALLPCRFFVAASLAPHVERADKPMIHRLPDERFYEGLRRYQGIPESLLSNAEFMSLLIPMLRADFEVLETYHYVPESPLDVSMSAFGGLSDPEIKPDDVVAWNEQTSAGFSVQFFPGDHLFLRTAAKPLLAVVARELESI